MPSDPGLPIGLTTEEAARRLAETGPNDPAPVVRYSAARDLARAFLSPLVLMLLVASVISQVIGESVDAELIVLIVVIGVGINFAQTYRSQKAAAKLRDAVAPRASVLRDGVWSTVARRDVVPGDVVRLSAGDLVPADANLTSQRDLHVQESVLTGESLPVEKALGDSIFLGTSVISGTATALVTATGPQTKFGEIAVRLASRAPETEFDRGLRLFSYLILRTTLFLVLFLVTTRIARHGNPMESLLFAVALAVGLTPEFLPMITSLALAKGAMRMAESKVIVRNLAGIENLGAIDVLLSDKTGTLTAGAVKLEASLAADGTPSPHPQDLAYWNSFFQTGMKSPLDTAILAACAEPAEHYEKIDEAPFDFERRRLSVVVEKAVVETTAKQGASERLLIVKGAPESVLSVCTTFDHGDAATAAAQYNAISRQGKRALAVASRVVPMQPAYAAADEHSLTLNGFLVFADPLLPGAADAIADMRRDGVTVKILTGDSALVAENVCGQVGLDGNDIITGDDLEHMTDAALGHVAETSTVFARLSPAQKLRILSALQRRGHVVGFMGDGVNDAPSLHTADIGIAAVGATDVAREAAGIVLTAPGLAILHTGIIEGRRAYGNILKYLLMGTSSNFGNMLSMAVASTVLPFLPMLPTQILVNNFLYDLAQITIPSDSVDHELLAAPHRWNIRIVRNFMIGVGPVSSLFDFLTFWVLLRVFHAPEAEFQTGWFVESLATQTLVLLVIRTLGNPLKSRPSAPLAASVAVIVALAFALPYSPVAHRLGFVPLPASYLVFVIVATLIYLGLVEIVKRALVRSPMLEKN